MSVLIAHHPEEQRQDTVKQTFCAREGAVEPPWMGLRRVCVRYLACDLLIRTDI
jgi:hypothetical protein